MGARAVPGGADRSRSVLVVVFTTILIDFAGLSVLFPVLPLYAERLGATPFEVGLIATVFSLAQLLFLPAWGWVSDRIGRRPVILASLGGTALSFLALAFAEDVRSIYAARAIAGFFAASVATAQAVVTDVTPPSERARGLGLIGAAFGLGMLVGPTLGGLLSAVDPRAPFFAIVGLATANLALAWVRLPESRPPQLARAPWRRFARSLVPPPVRLALAVQERRIRTFLYLFFHVFTAFSVLEAMFTLYAGIRFGANAFDMGLVFAWIALFLVVTQGYALRRLVPRFGEARLVVAGLALMALGLALVAAVPGFPWLYAVGPLLAVGNGLAIPSFTSLYTQACESAQAGELLGQSQSMATTGRIAGPLLGGVAMERIGVAAPFWIAAALMAAAGIGVVVAGRSLLGPFSQDDRRDSPRGG